VFFVFVVLGLVMVAISNRADHYIFSSVLRQEIGWGNIPKTRMWANAQRVGRPAEHRWRPLFNAANFGWRSLLDCGAVTLPSRESRWN